MLAIIEEGGVAVALVADVDHYVTFPYQTAYGKGYGHNIYLPLAIQFIVRAAYLGRRVQVRFLRRTVSGAEKAVLEPLMSAFGRARSKQKTSSPPVYAQISATRK